MADEAHHITLQRIAWNVYANYLMKTMTMNNNNIFWMMRNFQYSIVIASRSNILFDCSGGSVVWGALTLIYSGVFSSLMNKKKYVSHGRTVINN